MSILIIDDDKNIRDIFSMVLKVEGYEVQSASDGEDGLACLREGLRPSLILLDMMMPRLDGEGFIEALRRDPAMADIPIVVITGHPSGRARAEALGVAGWLVKPVELSNLLNMVAAKRLIHPNETLKRE